MMAASQAGEAIMRSATVLFAVVPALLALDGLSGQALADQKIRLAQTSAVTNCMMTCNSQAATCQAACVVPGTPPTGAATTTSNANSSTSCQLNCSTQQLSCQTICARTSPSP
jgi:hypothetical protein